MKTAIVILAFLVYSCSPQRYIEVREELMVLVDKVPAYRHISEDECQDYMWLIWESRSGVLYARRVKKEIADTYSIGAKTTNMNRL